MDSNRERIVIIVTVFVAAVIALIYLKPKKKAAQLKMAAPSSLAARNNTMTKLAQEGVTPTLNGQLINGPRLDGTERLSTEGVGWTVDTNTDMFASQSSMATEAYQPYGNNLSLSAVRTPSTAVFSKQVGNAFIGPVK